MTHKGPETNDPTPAPGEAHPADPPEDPASEASAATPASDLPTAEYGPPGVPQDTEPAKGEPAESEPGGGPSREPAGTGTAPSGDPAGETETDGPEAPGGDPEPGEPRPAGAGDAVGAEAEPGQDASPVDGTVPDGHAALIEFYAGLGGGWEPCVAALQAFRERRVAGDWDVLARFLAGEPVEGERLRVVRTEDGDEAGVVHGLVKELTAEDERALLIAPTQEQVAELLGGLVDDTEVFSLLIETRAGEAPEAPPAQESGSERTVEFRPVGGPEEAAASSAVTRAEPLPVLDERPPAPAARVRSAALRPVGEAWRRSWETEVRLLQRGLVWLEQWPRDAAALEAVRTENLRRKDELAAEQARLRDAIEEARDAARTAGQAAAEADAEAERLGGIQGEAEAELVEPRAEAERLQAEADEASAAAGALTRTADAAYARCVQMDERAKTAQAELQAARQTEVSLTDELARAREALPGAAEEAHRLAAADADAAAEGHAAYYRLVSAESALSALRRRMTLGQRLHVASPPAELKSLRAEVKARAREADEAARRAREAKDAAEHAERLRRGLASFVSEGGARLQAAKEAQERLGTELTRLAAEREKAGAEHQEQARLASQAVEAATQAGMRARRAQQVVRELENRVNAARAAREEAVAAAGRARADAESALAAADERALTLERRAAEAAEEMSVREGDLATAAETEARSRENVRDVCGVDPAADPDAVAAHQRRAFARIEQLTGYLEGGRAAESEVLLRTADLVAGTPAGVGRTAREEEFDALVVVDAGAVTDAEFLIGAVRARRWILVGAPGSRPPRYREYGDAPPELGGGLLERGQP